MSRGRKERTPAHLAVLTQAREKAKIVIAERAKLNASQKTIVSVPVPEEALPPPPPPEPEDVAPLLPNLCRRISLLLPNMFMCPKVKMKLEVQEFTTAEE